MPLLRSGSAASGASYTSYRCSPSAGCAHDVACAWQTTSNNAQQNSILLKGLLPVRSVPHLDAKLFPKTARIQERGAGGNSLLRNPGQEQCSGAKYLYLWDRSRRRVKNYVVVVVSPTIINSRWSNHLLHSCACRAPCWNCKVHITRHLEACEDALRICGT